MKQMGWSALATMLLVAGTGCAFIHRTTETIGGEKFAGKLLGRDKCWICGKRMRSYETLEKHVAGHEK